MLWMRKLEREQERKEIEEMQKKRKRAWRGELVVRSKRGGRCGSGSGSGVWDRGEGK